jgi:hypothetical protein
MKQRLWLFFPCLAITCWLGMMLVHESGHMLAVLATGGTIQHLEFPLLGFSRTDIAPNPHPLIIAWVGPSLGALIPLVFALFLQTIRRPLYTANLLSGFCLLANGAYLAIGSLQHIGDAGDLLRQGTPLWSLIAAGIPMLALGIYQWHTLGPRLGLGIRNKSIDTYVTAGSATVLISLSLLVG